MNRKRQGDVFCILKKASQGLWVFLHNVSFFFLPLPLYETIKKLKLLFVQGFIDLQSKLLYNRHSGEKNKCKNTFHMVKLKAHLLITQVQIYCSAASACILTWQTTYDDINTCNYNKETRVTLKFSLMLILHYSTDWLKHLFITTEMLSWWKLVKYFLNHRLDMSWEVW